MEAATDRYLDSARSRLIGNALIPRAATQALLSSMAETSTDSVLTGKAGSGKSACVVELVDGLRAREDVPVLAFRLDRVPLSSNSTTAELGDYLRLEESPVLVLKAAIETAARPGVLIIDQLDAASAMSGRSAGAFDLVDQLIREVRGARARAVIHTVVVCRAFDWQHDHRLRQLVPARVPKLRLTLPSFRWMRPRLFCLPQGSTLHYSGRVNWSFSGSRRTCLYSSKPNSKLRASPRSAPRKCSLTGTGIRNEGQPSAQGCCRSRRVATGDRGPLR